MMTEEDDLLCGRPLSKPVLTNGARLCLTWKANEQFARDQVVPFQDNNTEVNVTLHYLSPGTSLPNHGDDSGWKTIHLDRLGLVELHKESTANSGPRLIDEAAIVSLFIAVEELELHIPVPVLMFFKVSIIGTSIDMFTSSPLVSFIPKVPFISTKTQCNNILPSLEAAAEREPCPSFTRQAFQDPDLVANLGCTMSSAYPNRHFNCFLNPNAQQCFLR